MDVVISFYIIVGYYRIENYVGLVGVRHLLSLLNYHKFEATLFPNLSDNLNSWLRDSMSFYFLKSKM